ncbi:MAG: transposase [Gammaproteobacteria bacterium]|nr:transposase [Gammaproteobacteria bacterium]
MPRMARLVVPGYPHHVTQRGNRGQITFPEKTDYLAYLELVSELKDEAGVDIWAYCLMPNHVHLVAVPQHKHSLAKLFGVAHRRYARQFNAARGWTGHLWQDRFHSFVMDETHLLAAVRYVELNPLRARLCSRPDHWRWSSAAAHLKDTPDSLVSVSPMRERISDWHRYLCDEVTTETLDTLRKHTRSGRPAGDSKFIEELEALTGLRLRRRLPGPPKAR